MSDLREIGLMVESVLMNMDAIIYVDRFAVGANDGGRYVSLYNSKMNLRLVNVYHEQFYRLPDFIAGRIEELADDCDIPLKLAQAERQNRVQECPKFKATRFRKPLRQGQDATESSWKFGAVLRVLGKNRGTIEKREEEEADPLINSDQESVLNDYLDVIFEDGDERKLYVNACLNKFGVSEMKDVKQSQVLLWKKYLDGRLQAKLNGVKIQKS